MVQMPGIPNRPFTAEDTRKWNQRIEDENARRIQKKREKKERRMQSIRKAISFLFRGKL